MASQQQSNLSTAFVILRPQIWLILELQNCLQIYSRGLVTLELATSGFQNGSQIDTKSITYPPLIHSKTNSDFGLRMTFLFRHFFLDLEHTMASKYIKSYITSKHASNKIHQQCIGVYQFYKESSMYMSATKVLLEQLNTKSKVDFYVHLIFCHFGIPFGSMLDAEFIRNRIWRASDER